MREAYDRIKEAEEQRRGLVIMEAWYGNLASAASENSVQQKYVDLKLYWIFQPSICCPIFYLAPST